MTRPYCDPPARVLADTASRSEGLTAAEAARRLAENGPNRLRQPPRDPLLRRFCKQLADPMTLVLLGAALVSAPLPCGPAKAWPMWSSSWRWSS